MKLVRIFALWNFVFCCDVRCLFFRDHGSATEMERLFAVKSISLNSWLPPGTGYSLIWLLHATAIPALCTNLLIEYSSPYVHLKCHLQRLKVWLNISPLSIALSSPRFKAFRAKEKSKECPRADQWTFELVEEHVHLNLRRWGTSPNRNQTQKQMVCSGRLGEACLLQQNIQFSHVFTLPVAASCWNIPETQGAWHQVREFWWIKSAA